MHPPNLLVPKEEQDKVQPMFTNRSEFELDKNKFKLNSYFATVDVCHNHVFTNDVDNIKYSTINQIIYFGGPVPAKQRK